MAENITAHNAGKFWVSLDCQDMDMFLKLVDRAFLFAECATLLNLDETLVRSWIRRTQQVDPAWRKVVGKRFDRDVILVYLL